MKTIPTLHTVSATTGRVRSAAVLFALKLIYHHTAIDAFHFSVYLSTTDFICF